MVWECLINVDEYSCGMFLCYCCCKVLVGGFFGELRAHVVEV